MIAGKKVAVVMIVKNEEKVITRALESVRAFTDLIVISDTGSTDDTLKVAKDWCVSNNAPVYVSEDGWHNFAFNRNVALNNAKAVVVSPKDWLFLSLDADDQFVFDNAFLEGTSNELKAASLGVHVAGVGSPEYVNAISVSYKLHALKYLRVSLIGAVDNWRWEGHVHEYLAFLGDKSTMVHGELTGGHIKASSSEGSRSANPNKYLDDAKLLEAVLDTDCYDTRSTFYLARSYHDHFKLTGKTEYLMKATSTYELRATMTTPETEVFEEERWYAQYMCASLCNNLPAMLDVSSQRPWRVEVSLECSRIAEAQGKMGMAVTYALLAASVKEPRPGDVLFVDTSVYGWRALDRLGTVAYYSNLYQIGLNALQECLEVYESAIPRSDLARINANRQFYLEKLAPDK